METKEAIRKQLYDYIGKNIGHIDEGQAAIIKGFILAHDNTESKKELKQGQRIQFTKDKINLYLTKSKTLPLLNDRIQGEVAALKLVLNWLNSDAE